MFKEAKAKTFSLEDLVGRVIGIQSFRDNNMELIMAKDLKTGEFFVLKQITHPEGEKCVSGSS